MLYDLSMSESTKYEKLQGTFNPTVYVIQEIAGTRAGNPKINIMGASNYGQFKFLLPEFSQIIFSPGPLIYKLRQGLKNYKPRDYLLLTGDPAIIGVACSIVSDITGGKFNLLFYRHSTSKSICIFGHFSNKSLRLSSLYLS